MMVNRASGTTEHWRMGIEMEREGRTEAGEMNDIDLIPADTGLVKVLMVIR